MGERGGRVGGKEAKHVSACVRQRSFFSSPSKFRSYCPPATTPVMSSFLCLKIFLPFLSPFTHGRYRGSGSLCALITSITQTRTCYQKGSSSHDMFARDCLRTSPFATCIRAYTHTRTQYIHAYLLTRNTSLHT